MAASAGGSVTSGGLDFLMVDELGYMPMDSRRPNPFFDRHARGSQEI
jgi:hypothetical protein